MLERPHATAPSARVAATALREALEHHIPADDSEARHLREILEFVTRHEEPFDRRIPEGHLTGSAFVLSRDGERVLLVHHRKLARWLQPGGHAEAGEDTGERVALREAKEETGLTDLALHPLAPRPLDVDVHVIPARHDEPRHLHLDLRYLVIAGEAQAPRVQEDECHAVRWFAWPELEALRLDAGLVRGLRKAHALTPASE